MSTRPPVNDWATDFDHLDPRWVENPYPIWEELRTKCPIAHTERFRGVYRLRLPLPTDPPLTSLSASSDADLDIQD